MDELINKISNELFEIKEDIPDGKYVKLMNQMKDFHQKANKITLPKLLTPYIMNIEWIERKEEAQENHTKRQNKNFLLMLKKTDYTTIKSQMPFLYSKDLHDDLTNLFNFNYDSFLNDNLLGNNRYDYTCYECDTTYYNLEKSITYLIKGIKPFYRTPQIDEEELVIF